MKQIILVCTILMMISCVNESRKQEGAENTVNKNSKTMDDSDLATKLFSQYYAEPKNQQELDQNALLDYAVDNGLDVTRTKTGLFYVIHEEGKGPLLQRGQPTRAHYRGYFTDGKILIPVMTREDP